MPDMPAFWPDVIARTGGSLLSAYGFGPPLIAAALSWVLTRMRHGGWSAVHSPSNGWKQWWIDAGLSVGVAAFVFVVSAVFMGFAAASARDDEWQGAYDRVQNNARGVDQRYDALEQRVWNEQARQTILAELGEIRDFFVFRRVFAAYGARVPADTLESNWTGYTLNVRRTLDLFKREPQFFTQADASQFNFPASRHVERYPYDQSPEHARMWVQCQSSINVLDEIITRIRSMPSVIR